MRMSDWSSDVCSSDLLLRSGRRWREAPDEGASEASCSCASQAEPGQKHASLRSLPSSALRAPSPVNGRRLVGTKLAARPRCLGHEPRDRRYLPPRAVQCPPPISEERREGKGGVSPCRSSGS